jgi:DNA-binding MarR family transcriptional regulator
LDKDVIRSETLPLMVMIDSGNVIERALEVRMLPLRLSVAQQRLMTAVYFAEGKLTPGLLSSLMLQEPHSISTLLNRLEDRGLVTRTHDRQDRRVAWVGLTDEGRRVSEEGLAIVRQFCQEIGRAHV